jgi:hypothetical protein
MFQVLIKKKEPKIKKPKPVKEPKELKEPLIYYYEKKVISNNIKLNKNVVITW